MGAKAEVVATGIRFAEGPVWCSDGTVVCTSVADGALERVHLTEGRVERVVAVGGGANATQLASDGGFVVTQNGGIDFTQTGLYEDPPPYRPTTPGIQRVAPNGSVTYIADEGFLAPNDLVVAEDGSLWFTDPPGYPPPEEARGRVHVMAPDGSTRVVAEGLHYPNGIALEPDGTPVIIEGTGLQRLLGDDREWITERFDSNDGDGFCVDAEGRFYVAVTASHGIRVLDRDGSDLDFLPIEGPGVTTNCCFGGDDLRTLFATDGLPGQLVVWESMPTAGLPVRPWPVPQESA